MIGSTDILKQVAQKLDAQAAGIRRRSRRMSLLKRALIIVGLVSDPNEIRRKSGCSSASARSSRFSRVEKSRVIVIEMSSEDPQLAAKIPNAIADVYLSVQRDAKLVSNADATDWLNRNRRPDQARQGCRDKGRKLPLPIRPVDRPEQFRACDTAAFGDVQ